MSELTGIFKNRYRLSGRDWVRLLSPEDLRFFIHLGLQAMDYGRKGGIARSLSASRDSKGRFAKDPQ